MSKVVSVRLSDELVKKLEGRKAAEVVTAALELYFHPPVERKRGAMQEEGLVEGAGQAGPVSLGTARAPKGWYPTSKCPHGWVNSFACRENKGGC